MDKKRNMLLIEDDKVDIMTIERAIKDLKILNPLDIVFNGQEAINFLRNEKNPKPSLILLDINMPVMNGIEFLKIVKADDTLKIIPVVVLTTSREEQDKFNGFQLGVAGYMVKPVDYKQFVEVIRTINLYWLLSEVPI